MMSPLQPSSSRTSTSTEIEAIVQQLFGLALSQAVDLDSDFFVRGGDSMQALALITSLQNHFNVRLPADALFRWTTPRQLAAAVASPLRRSSLRANGGLVRLNEQEAGCPVFMVPGYVPTPWEYQPLVQAVNLAQPVYGLRCGPDLDSPSEVITLSEMITHYVTSIRQEWPNGPYAFVGYSWGGVIAFEIANRLAKEGQVVSRLVMLDTGLPSHLGRYLFFYWPWRLVVLSWLARNGLGSARLWAKLGAAAVTVRVLMPFGTGPLTTSELRRVLRSTVFDYPPAADQMLLPELCAELATAVKRSMAPDEWHRRMSIRHLPPDDPVAVVKFWKTLAKNRLMARAYRPRAVFPGTITIYAAEGNKGVLNWGQYSRQLEATWYPVKGRSGGSAHDDFLAPDNIALYAHDLGALLGAAGTQRHDRRD
jgi:acyl carrier protein